MYNILLGALLLGLTTGLTCLFVLYPGIIKTAMKLGPMGLVSTSRKFRMQVYGVGFFASMLLFPFLMIVLMVPMYQESFHDHLSVRLSQA